MTPPDEQNPPQVGDSEQTPAAVPPPGPEEAAAEAGAPTGEGTPAPPADLGPRTGGDQPTSNVVPDAATAPAPEPAATEAPTAEKPVEQKAEPEAPPSQTGTPPAEAPAEKAAEPEKPASAAKPPAGERPARPTREAEPKEAPRVAPPPGSVYEPLAAAVPGVEMKAYMVPSLGGESVAVEVPREGLTAVMTAARDDPKLDLKYLRDLAGVDWQEQGLEVVYHLWSFTNRHGLTVKTRVGYDDAKVPSIVSLFPAADWHERETRDMFGITFEGHPNLVPLLLPEDMTDHFPLRKDNPLQEIEEWQGENLREGAGEGDE